MFDNLKKISLILLLMLTIQKPHLVSAMEADAPFPIIPEEGNKSKNENEKAGYKFENNFNVKFIKGVLKLWQLAFTNKDKSIEEIIKDNDELQLSAIAIFAKEVAEFGKELGKKFYCYTNKINYFIDYVCYDEAKKKFPLPLSLDSDDTAIKNKRNVFIKLLGQYMYLKCLYYFCNEENEKDSKIMKKFKLIVKDIFEKHIIKIFQENEDIVEKFVEELKNYEFIHKTGEGYKKCKFEILEYFLDEKYEKFISDMFEKIFNETKCLENLQKGYLKSQVEAYSSNKLDDSVKTGNFLYYSYSSLEEPFLVKIANILLRCIYISNYSFGINKYNKKILNGYYEFKFVEFYDTPLLDSSPTLNEN